MNSTRPKKKRRLLKRLIAWPLVVLLLALGYWQIRLAQRLPTPKDPTLLIPAEAQLYIRLRSPAELLKKLPASAFWRSWYWVDETGKKRAGDPPWLTAIANEEERQEAREELAERRQLLFMIETFGKSDLHAVLLPFPNIPKVDSENPAERPEDERERWLFMTRTDGKTAEAMIAGIEALLRFSHTLREHTYKTIPVRIWLDEEDPGKSIHTLRLGELLVFGMGTVSPRLLEPIIDTYLRADEEPVWGLRPSRDPRTELSKQLAAWWENPMPLLGAGGTDTINGKDAHGDAANKRTSPYFLCYSAAPGFSETLMEGARLQLRQGDPEDALERLNNALPAYRHDLISLLWQDDDALRFVRRATPETPGLFHQELSVESDSKRREQMIEPQFVAGLISGSSAETALKIRRTEEATTDPGLKSFLRFALYLLEESPELSEGELIQHVQDQLGRLEAVIAEVAQGPTQFEGYERRRAVLKFAENLASTVDLLGEERDSLSPWAHLLIDLAGMRLVMELESRPPQLNPTGDQWDPYYLEAALLLSKPPATRP